jgi:uncharacterized membrane protein YgdD (TMEM256/DUF423 family)
MRLASYQKGGPSAGNRKDLEGTRNMWIRIAGISGAFAVLAGAFGAHGLSGAITPQLLAAYRTGASYHLVHSVVLLCLALSSRAETRPRPALLLLARIVVFSGSLYVMALTGLQAHGAVTPVGGLLLILGWADVAVSLGAKAPADHGSPHPRP